MKRTIAVLLCLAMAFTAAQAQNFKILSYKGTSYELANGGFSREQEEKTLLELPENMVMEYDDDFVYVRLFSPDGFELLMQYEPQANAYIPMYDYNGGRPLTGSFFSSKGEDFVFGFNSSEKKTSYARTDLYSEVKEPSSSYEELCKAYLDAGGRPSLGVKEDLRIRRLEQPASLQFYHYFLSDPTCAFGNMEAFTRWLERSIRYQYPDADGKTELQVIVPRGGGYAKYEILKSDASAEVQKLILDMVELVKWKEIHWTTLEYHKEFRAKPGESQCVFFSAPIFSSAK